MLYSRPVDGVPCKFQTSYDVDALADYGRRRAVDARPIGSVRRRGSATRRPCSASSCAVRPDITFAQLELDTLRFYLDGAGNLTAALYELLNTSGREIIVREVAAGGRAAASPKMITLPASALRPAGFGPNEGMLPYPGPLVRGVSPDPGILRLSREVSLPRSERLRPEWRPPGSASAIEILIPIPAFERAEWRPMLEAGVTASTFRLGCTPIVNLFPHVLRADPADAAAAGVSARGRRAPAPHDGDLLGRRA